MRKLFLVLLASSLISGCASNWNLAGWSFFNQDSEITNDIEAEQKASQVNVHTELNRPLTPEEIKQVEKSVEDGINLVKEAMEERQSFMGARIHYVRAGKRDWPGWENPNLTRDEFIKRHPKMEDAHKDLVTLMHEIWKIHPTFIVTATLRDAERQKRLLAQGRTTTMRSKHLRIPAEAADIVGKRRGKIDWKDLEIFGTYHGIGLGLATFLERLPCHMFGSKVRRVIDWKSFRDLPHHEILPRKECKQEITWMMKIKKFLSLS